MIPYNPLNPAIEMAEMFGFIKRENDTAVISNRIFETVLYNYFLSEEFLLLILRRISPTSRASVSAS